MKRTDTKAKTNDERPFLVHPLQPWQQELAEPPSLLDLPEYRLHRCHSQGVPLPPRFVRSLRRILSRTDSSLGMRPRGAGSGLVMNGSTARA